MTWDEAQLDAAVAALSRPGALDEAQKMVARRAPALQLLLHRALDDSDWFGPAHQAQVAQAANEEDRQTRYTAVRTLIAEETRVSMLIGVAVGFELHRRMTTPEEETDGT